MGPQLLLPARVLLALALLLLLLLLLLAALWVVLHAVLPQRCHHRHQQQWGTHWAASVLLESHSQG
jgi:hypothetical protein